MNKTRRATSRSRTNRPATAEHRPAARRRRFRHDDLVAVDLFSGFGGLTQGIKMAGFTTIMAANHDRYKVEVHEANHPEAEHWIADLVDVRAVQKRPFEDVRRDPQTKPLGKLLHRPVLHARIPLLNERPGASSLIDSDPARDDTRSDATPRIASDACAMAQAHTFVRRVVHMY